MDAIGFWGMIVMVVLIGAISEMYRARLKSRERIAAAQDDVEKLAEQVRRLEQRLANVESLVVEREKSDAFDRALQ